MKKENKLTVRKIGARVQAEPGNSLYRGQAEAMQPGQNHTMVPRQRAGRKQALPTASLCQRGRPEAHTPPPQSEKLPAISL